jgi:hypothetical protein
MEPDLNADRRVSHSSHCLEGLNFWSDNGFLGIVPPGTRVGDFLYRIGHSNAVLVVHPGCSTTQFQDAPSFAQYHQGPKTFSLLPSSVKIDPYKYHLDHQLQISTLRCKLSTYLALSIRQSTFGHSFAGLAIDDRLFVKITPLSRLISAGLFTSTIFAYQDSAAPTKERYVQPLGTRLNQTVISHICSKCRLMANAKPVSNSFLEV